MPRAGLSRAVIAGDAAELADESGWDQLTLAAVAARFGVRQPSLYKHVAGLGELRRDVSVLAAQELHHELTAAAVGKSGADALHAMAGAYRTFAKKHPGRYEACVIAPPPGDIEYQQVAERGGRHHCRGPARVRAGRAMTRSTPSAACGR